MLLCQRPLADRARRPHFRVCVEYARFKVALAQFQTVVITPTDVFGLAGQVFVSVVHSSLSANLQVW